jgi:hypothetical protein
MNIYALIFVVFGIIFLIGVMYIIVEWLLGNFFWGDNDEDNSDNGIL